MIFYKLECVFDGRFDKDGCSLYFFRGVRKVKIWAAFLVVLFRFVSRYLTSVSSQPRRNRIRLDRDIRIKGLEVRGRFVILMIMKMNSVEKEYVSDVRRIVTLVEAILSIWVRVF